MAPTLDDLIERNPARIAAIVAEQEAFRRSIAPRRQTFAAWVVIDPLTGAPMEAGRVPVLHHTSSAARMWLMLLRDSGLPSLKGARPVRVTVTIERDD